MNADSQMLTLEGTLKEIGSHILSETNDEEMEGLTLSDQRTLLSQLIEIRDFMTGRVSAFLTQAGNGHMQRYLDRIIDIRTDKDLAAAKRFLTAVGECSDEARPVLVAIALVRENVRQAMSLLSAIEDDMEITCADEWLGQEHSLSMQEGR